MRTNLLVKQKMSHNYSHCISVISYGELWSKESKVKEKRGVTVCTYMLAGRYCNQTGGMGLLEYLAMTSLRDIAHDATDGCINDILFYSILCTFTTSGF